mgnify:CR=1 FL=1
MQYDSKNDTLNHIGEVRNLLEIVKNELDIRGVLHDNSKLSKEEKTIFDKYTPMLKNTTYGSNEYKKYLKEMKENKGLSAKGAILITITELKKLA